MTAPALDIVPLADRPELIPVVARWHWDEWGHEDPGGSPEGWVAGLRRLSGRVRIPISWVALDGRAPVGSVALVGGEAATHRELSPWVSRLFVVPEYRERGIGSSLTAHCERAAAALGVRKLYLHTRNDAFYRRRGWEVVGPVGQLVGGVALMVKDIGAA